MLQRQHFLPTGDHLGNRVSILVIRGLDLTQHQRDGPTRASALSDSLLAFIVGDGSESFHSGSALAVAQ
jgi:hypothetical protein